MLAHMLEMLSWGDVGMYLVTPGGGLGAAAVEAAATPEQKQKFLARFGEEKPTFAAMCMTEPGAGSDTSAIKTTAYLDEKTNEWVINGEKIFVTAGHKSMVPDECFGKGFIVVWASIDPIRWAGRHARLCHRTGDTRCNGDQAGAQDGYPRQRHGGDFPAGRACTL
jgi:acyl-CoA dehydrogenase